MCTVYGTLAASVLLLFSIQLSAAQADQGFTSEEKQVFHNYLDRVADKLVKNAVKQDGGIAWVNVTPDDKLEESIDFYGGNSGTCYFFLKAYAATHESAHLDTAKHCMSYILGQAKKDDLGLYFPDQGNGFFRGDAGPAYL